MQYLALIGNVTILYTFLTIPSFNNVNMVFQKLIYKNF